MYLGYHEDLRSGTKDVFGKIDVASAETLFTRERVCRLMDGGCDVDPALPRCTGIKCDAQLLFLFV